MNQYNVHNLKIDPRLFQHPIDKTAADAIRNMPAFQKALEYISKNSIEKQLGVVYRSSLAQITAKNSPVMFKMLEEAAEMFEVPVLPEIYLERAYPMVIYLRGIEQPMLRLSAQLIEELTEETLWSMLASQMAGIKQGYAEIKMVEWLCTSARGLLPDPIVSALSMAFGTWAKYAEFSLDRARLIVSGDFNATIRECLAGEAPKEVLANIDFSDPNCDFMKQCREYASNEDREMRLLRNTKAILGKYNSYAARYLDLFEFYQTEYHDLMDEYLD